MTCPITIPARIAKLPRFRGFPIPFTALIEEDGNVDFRVSDQHKWSESVLHRLCGVCGERLDHWIFFVGGPVSMDSKAFYDPPMHEECARYSVQVCPFLAGDKGYAQIDQIRAKHPGHILTEIPMKSSLLTSVGMLKCRHYDIITDPEERHPPILKVRGAAILTWLRGDGT